MLFPALNTSFSAQSTCTSTINLLGGFLPIFLEHFHENSLYNHIYTDKYYTIVKDNTTTIDKFIKIQQIVINAIDKLIQITYIYN